MARRRIMTQKQYRTNDRAEGCPRCEGRRISSGNGSFGPNSAYEQHACRDCGLIGETVYRIAGYIREGHENRDGDALFTVECTDLAAMARKP